MAFMTYCCLKPLLSEIKRNFFILAIFFLLLSILCLVSLITCQIWKYWCQGKASKRKVLQNLLKIKNSLWLYWLRHRISTKKVTKLRNKKKLLRSKTPIYRIYGVQFYFQTGQFWTHNNPGAFISVWTYLFLAWHLNLGSHAQNLTDGNYKECISSSIIE